MKQLTKLGEAALRYAQPHGERPAWAVFPLGEGGKRPRIPKKDGGHGFLDATTDPDQIRQWWEKYPQANIGVATGEKSGFIVIDVDIDTEKGKDGSIELAELERQLGDLPDGPRQLTPRGGTHYLFKNPAGYYVQNSEGGEVNKTTGEKTGLAEGIDVRGNGGYIAVAPSPRKDQDGKEYQWDIGAQPIDTPLPDLPTAWLEHMVACGIAKRSSTTPPGELEQRGQRFALPGKIKAGQRNGTLFKYACSLRAQNYPEDRLAQMVMAVNLDRCDPALDDAEVQTIIASVMRYPGGTSMAVMGYSNGKPRLTNADLCNELAAMGFSVRLNVITGNYETSGRTAAGRVPDLDDLVTLLYDALADTYKGVSFDVLRQFIAYQGRENKYNPVKDLLQATTWDEIDRLPQVYALIGIEHDELSKTLVYKWLRQTVALLFNEHGNGLEPYGADGCLVFNGEQGTGKTSFFRHLALKAAWFGEGCKIDDRDKDTSRRVVTRWISELGEVETTLKSDIEAVKNFITASTDRYRLPYGRTDIDLPRISSLCATCNSERYLIDQTGNRRWWSVPFTRRVPHEELQQLDALQLWAQIFSEVAPLSCEKREKCYRLTDEEQAALAQRNGDYEKKPKGQDEVEDILARAERDNLATQSMTISEFKGLWPELRIYSVQQISTALKRCGVETTLTKKGKTVRREALLPCPYTSGFDT